MKTALFIMFRVPSHYNACFGLADSLRCHGDRVVFTGTSDLQKHIEGEGFEFVPLHCLQKYVIPNGRVALGLFLKSMVDKRFLSRRYREFWGNVLLFRQLCQTISPDTVYIDQHLNHYYFLLERQYRNVILFNTKLPTRRASGIPPLTCEIPFKQNWFYSTYAQLLWLSCGVRRWTLDQLKRMVFLGTDDNFFLNRCAMRNGLDYHKQRLRYNALYESIRDVEIIHLRPRLLEYGWYKLNENERFAYYPYRRSKILATSQIKIWDEFEELIKGQKEQGKFIVYASLGTLSSLNREFAIRFLQRLSAAVSQMQNVYLIISAGKLARFLNDGLPTNVSLFEWVSQPELLFQCDLMITHGGMNSICDCLYAGVPMLVYPLNLNSDQPGNAARVVAKSLGLQGNLRRDTEAEMKKKTVEILTNLAFRENIRRANRPPIINWQSTLDLAESR